MPGQDDGGVGGVERGRQPGPRAFVHQPGGRRKDGGQNGLAFGHRIAHPQRRPQHPAGHRSRNGVYVLDPRARLLLHRDGQGAGFDRSQIDRDRGGPQQSDDREDQQRKAQRRDHPADMA